MKKIVSVLLLMCFFALPVSADTAVQITSPAQDVYSSADSITLSANVTNAEHTVFSIDGEKIKVFGADTSPAVDIDVSGLSYGEHPFTVKSFKKGEALASDSKKFTVTDISASVAYTDNFNTFSGISGSTYGFVSNDNGTVSVGTGPDGSPCMKLQGTNINDTNVYLPWMNFGMTDVSSILEIEENVLVSDDGMRLIHEMSGYIFNVFRYSTVGKKTMEPDKWYNLKTVIDFAKKTYKVYIDPNWSEEEKQRAFTKARLQHRQQMMESRK